MGEKKELIPLRCSRLEVLVIFYVGLVYLLSQQGCTGLWPCRICARHPGLHCTVSYSGAWSWSLRCGLFSGPPHLKLGLAFLSARKKECVSVVFMWPTRFKIFNCLVISRNVWAFPGDTVVKNLPAKAEDTRDTGSIPGAGKILWRRDGYPLQCSCLENSIDRGARQATSCGVPKSQTRLSD